MKIHSLLLLGSTLVLPVGSVFAGTLSIDNWYAAVTAESTNVVAATSGTGGGQTGATGGGWAFDGTTASVVDSFNFGNLNTGTSGVSTVEFVINCTNLASESAALAKMFGYGSEVSVFKYPQYASSGKIGITFPGQNDYSFNTSAIITNADTHVAFVTDASHNLSLYVNGVLVETLSDRAGAWYTGGGVGVLGAYKNASNAFSDYFKGTIYGVATYSDALTSTQIATNYAALTTVPEPSTYALFGNAIIAVGIVMVRRRKK